MDELFDQYEQEFAAGETAEDFESWYSGKCADAADDAKGRQQDLEMGL